jgi:cytochrome c oxidase subunit 4
MANPTATPAPAATHAEDTHAGQRHINPVLVFVILTVITVVEIAITLFHLPKSFLVPALLAMSFAKAALVAAYYMHLRYEKLMYTIIFITPALFAVFLIFVLAAGN